MADSEDADFGCGRERANTWPGVRPGEPEDDFRNRRLRGRESGGAPSPGSGCSSRLGQICESNESLTSRRSSFGAAGARSDVAGTSPEAAAGAQARSDNSPVTYKAGHPSYVELITSAILSSPEKRMTLAEIYDWMVANVPAFKDQRHLHSSAGWKNSVRHNLSLHSRFKRVKRNGMDKPSWWTVDPTEQTKDRKHRSGAGAGGTSRSCRITTARLSTPTRAGPVCRPRSSGSWSFARTSTGERRRASDLGGFIFGSTPAPGGDSGRRGLAMGSLDRLRDEPIRLWECVSTTGAGESSTAARATAVWEAFGAARKQQSRPEPPKNSTGTAVDPFDFALGTQSEREADARRRPDSANNLDEARTAAAEESNADLTDLLVRHHSYDSAFASSTSLEESMEIGDTSEANLRRFVKAITVTLREQPEDRPGDCGKPRIALRLSAEAPLIERRLTVPAILSKFLRPSAAEESRQILRVQTNSGGVQDVAVPAPLPMKVVIHSDKQCQTDELEVALRQSLQLHSPDSGVSAALNGGACSARSPERDAIPFQHQANLLQTTHDTQSTFQTRTVDQCGFCSNGSLVQEASARKRLWSGDRRSRPPSGAKCSPLPDDLANLDVEGDVDCNIMDILRYDDEMCRAQNDQF